MKERRTTVTALLLLLCAACSGTGVKTSPGVEIKRSGMLAPGGPTVETVYWTDDTHVLFIGAKPGMFEALADGRERLKTFLMHWNTTTEEVKTLAELGEYAGLCYDRGYVLYWYRKPSDKSGRPGQAVFKAGPLGKEVEINLRRNINRFSCREYDGNEVEQTVGVGAVVLREEDGYLVGREDAREKGMSIYMKLTNTGREEILVPILGTYPRWSVFADAYVFSRPEDLISRTKTTGKMWLLKRDGRTKEFLIPAGPWFGGTTGYDITKRGLFMWSYALRDGTNGDAGGYLMEEGQLPERFIEGLIYAFGISPSGCKVALSINLHYGSRQAPEMISADLCREGK